MTHGKNAADRIRPILQAMERSIESARSRRLHDEPAHTPAAPSPIAAPHDAVIGSDEPNGEAPVRLKARPRRPDGPTWGGSIGS